MSALEEQMAFQLKAAKIPFVREFRPIPTRRWRVDFLIDDRLVVECEGGVWTQGRHNRGKGFIHDCEKYSELLIAGYRVLRMTAEHIESGQALQWVERARAA